MPKVQTLRSSSMPFVREEERASEATASASSSTAAGAVHPKAPRGASRKTLRFAQIRNPMLMWVRVA